MSGRSRLPGGEPRKASQRNSRRAEATPIRITPTYRTGDPVLWKDRAVFSAARSGTARHAEIAIGERVYRVRIAELA